MRWWRRRSLRARLTLIGVGGLAVGLALGAVMLVAALRYGLQRSVDAEALGTAENVAQMVAEDTLPEVVPVAGSQQVQVLNAKDQVVNASIQTDRLVPMLHSGELAAARRGARLYVDGSRLGQSGQLRVVAVMVRGPEGERTVLVARSVADVRQSVHVLQIVLWVAFPLLVAGLTGLGWRVLGAALAPVEALRRGAAEISGSARPGQLPLPPSHDEIHRLAVTLNDMLDRLEAARARQRTFVADAAHELRSPLTNMRTQLEVAQRLSDRTDWPAVADDLLVDTERLARLVDDLLLLARSDEAGPLGPADGDAGPRGAGPGGARPEPVSGGGGHPHPGRARPEPQFGGGEHAPNSPEARASGLSRSQPVELGGLLRRVAQKYPSPPVAVVEPGEPLWTVGEPDALHRILANLLDNAVRHARSAVVLAAGRDGAYHRVTVTDDGAGIPAADRERVFGRFTRLDDGRARDAGGAGLGLAIVRELVRRHGGTVRLAEAHPGRAGAMASRTGPGPRAEANGAGPGLRVEVRLPVLAEQPAPAEQPVSTA